MGKVKIIYKRKVFKNYVSLKEILKGHYKEKIGYFTVIRVIQNSGVKKAKYPGYNQVTVCNFIFSVGDKFIFASMKFDYDNVDKAIAVAKKLQVGTKHKIRNFKTCMFYANNPLDRCGQESTFIELLLSTRIDCIQRILPKNLTGKRFLTRFPFEFKQLGNVPKYSLGNVIDVIGYVKKVSPLRRFKNNMERKYRRIELATSTRWNRKSQSIFLRMYDDFVDVIEEGEVYAVANVKVSQLWNEFRNEMTEKLLVSTEKTVAFKIALGQHLKLLSKECLRKSYVADLFEKS